MSDYIFNIRGTDKDIGSDNQQFAFNGGEEERTFLLQEGLFGRNNPCNRDIYLVDLDRRRQFEDIEGLGSSHINDIGRSGMGNFKIKSGHYHSKECHKPLYLDEIGINPDFVGTSSDVFPTCREKHRRETHNKVEKRRRSFINDKIDELRNMLPEYIDRSKFKGKGSILKETVDYLSVLKKDHEKGKVLENRLNKLEAETRMITARLERFESITVSNLNVCRDQMHSVSCLHMSSNINRPYTKPSNNKPTTEIQSPPPIAQNYEENLNAHSTSITDDSTDDLPSAITFSDTLFNFF